MRCIQQLVALFLNLILTAGWSHWRVPSWVIPWRHNSTRDFIGSYSLKCRAFTAQHSSAHMLLLELTRSSFESPLQSRCSYFSWPQGQIGGSTVQTISIFSNEGPGQSYDSACETRRKQYMGSTWSIVLTFLHSLYRFIHWWSAILPWMPRPWWRHFWGWSFWGSVLPLESKQTLIQDLSFICLPSHPM